MSTHVDGAAPSVAPDPDDGEPDLQPSELDDGSQWVRAEIQRRIAVNRSTRGRHARRGDAAAPAADTPLERGARESPRREPRTPASGSSPQTVPLPPPGFVAAGDLPENYIPRHSVQTPGPAAEPAAPISGPIPIVRPAHGDSTEASSSAGPRRAPVGGPSLPPTGVPLPVRKKRSGPGTPLVGGGGAAGPWSRPGASLVPNEPVQRLGAPPGMLGGAEPLPSWGVPASPPRGFAATPVPVQAEPGPGRDDGRTTVDDVAGIAGSPGRVADYRDYPDYPDDDSDYPDDDDASTARDPVDDARADGADAAGGPSAAAFTDAVAGDTAAEDTPAAGTAADDETATGGGAAEPSPAEPSPVEPRPVEHSHVEHSPTEGGATEERALSEVTTTILPVVDGPMIHGGVAPPARLVGIPVQRASVAARTVAPRPLTPRNIPVVGTAPPEPGSTRVRVVLSERKGVARPVRTIKEVQEGTAVGELLRRDLIRSQLLVTLRFGALAVLVLGTLPAILTLLPAVGQFHVAGLRVPWLLLGVLMYPFLVGVAWRYTRVADRVEQNFADHVQD